MGATEDPEYTLNELKKKLTKKERIFCHEYIIDWNGSRAARVAGYSEKTANSISSEIIKKSYIIQYIKYIYPEYNSTPKSTKSKANVKNTGYIYLIKCKGTHYYKIGKSINGGKQRLAAMQTGIPFDLELILNIKCNHHDKIEKTIHGIFKDNSVRGEWFVFSDKLLAYVKTKIIHYGI